MKFPYLEKAYEFELISNYRRKSLSQKIRRDLLKIHILYPDNVERIEKLVSEFNILTNQNYKTIEDIFDHSYGKDFNEFLSEKSTFCQKSNNPTNVAIQIVDFFNKLNN